MTSWLNVITHNYICLLEPDLGLRKTIDAKLKQTDGVKLLVEFHMAAVWHTLSKWKETTITCISYYMCLKVTNKESEWLIPTFSLCVRSLGLITIIIAHYCTLCTFNYVLRWQINVATLVCFRHKWNNLSLWDILGKQLINLDLKGMSSKERHFF